MTVLGSMIVLAGAPDALHRVLELPAVQRLGWTLLHSLWEGAAVAVVLALVLTALRRGGPQGRYLAACMALAAMAVLPVVTFLRVEVRAPGPRPPASTAVATPQPAVAQAAPAGIVQVEDGAASSSVAVAPAAPHQAAGRRLGPGARAAESQTSAAAPAPGVSPAAPAPAGQVSLADRAVAALRAAAPWLVLVWAAGVLALSTWNLGGWLTVQRLKRSSTRSVGPEIESLGAKVARRLGLRRPVRLLQSALAGSPLVIGALRPAILLPVSLMTELSVGQLESILAHELAHVRRHDYLVNLLQSLIETLLFYHPAVWWISRQIRIEREHCCDDLAVEVTQNRAGYVRALAAVVASGGGAPRLAPAVTGCPARGALLRRVRRLLVVPERNESRHTLAGVGAGVFLIAVVAAAICFTTTTLPAQPAPAAAAPATTGDPPTSQPATASAGGNNADAAEPLPTYTGRVLTPGGEPVGGAAISTISFAKDLGPPVMRLGNTVRSAADGSFRIRASKQPFPSDPRLWLMVDAVGYGLMGASLDLPQAGDTTVQEIRLIPATELRVRFLGPDGKPVGGLRVAPANVMGADPGPGGPTLPSWHLGVPASERPRLSRQTDADGVCVLPGLPQGGQVQLKVDDPRFVSPEDRIPLRAQAMSEVPEPIRLRPAGSIRGRVLFADTGKPAPGVTVRATTSGMDPRSPRGDEQATTDERGEYHLTQLVEGKYNLIIYTPPALHDEWTAAALRDVAVAGGAEVAGQDIQLVKGGLVTGRLVNGDSGAGVPDETVFVYGPTRPRSGASLLAPTRPDGTFAVRAAPGTHTVVVSGNPPDGYNQPEPREQEVSVAEGQTVAVTIRYPRDPSPPLAGRVLGPDGKPVAGAGVVADAAGGGFGGQRFVRTDAEGRFRFAAVPAGSKVRAGKDGMATTQPAVAGAGEGDLVLKLQPVVPPPKASLEVTAINTEGKPVKGARVELFVQEGRMGHGTFDPKQVTDADGRYVLEGLAVDRQYSVWVDADGYGVSQAAVKPLTPGQKNVAEPIVLVHADKLIAGRVVDKDGKAKAGVPVHINGSDTGVKTTTSDADGRFRFKVVGAARPVIWLENEDGKSLRGRIVRAGTEDLEMVYDPLDLQR